MIGRKLFPLGWGRIGRIGCWRVRFFWRLPEAQNSQGRLARLLGCEQKKAVELGGKVVVKLNWRIDLKVFRNLRDFVHFDSALTLEHHRDLRVRQSKMTGKAAACLPSLSVEVGLDPLDILFCSRFHDCLIFAQTAWLRT